MHSKNTAIGHMAALGAYSIFGFNIIICKDLANSEFITPMGLFCFRAIGATVLFWLTSCFLPYEHVDKKDYFKIFMASFLGMFCTQLFFLKGITLATPLDTSILVSLTPIFTMFIAALALKEPITVKKAGGVALSFAGILLLIFNSISTGVGITKTSPIGIALLLANALSFAMYLGIFRPLIAKYHVVTFMKWIFFFSLISSVPFNIKELITIPYAELPTNYVRELLFLIIFSTYIAYFLIPIAQKYIRPTAISLYSYIQPMIASTISIIIGMDFLSFPKIIAASAVFIGIIFVNKSKSKADEKGVVHR